MAESVYKVIELVGTSTTSWEKATAAAVKRASKSLRDLRIAEVSQLDMAIENGKPTAYRARVKVSFKFDDAPVAKAAAPAPAPAKKAAPKKAAKKVAAPKKQAKKKARRKKRRRKKKG